ncbi:DUF2784 family protein [Nodosilinea sp. P-1105]|uniref:DUF2784 family protein n=1 Tax=Nodosilinea sp. P-1105 TaxID=2546229 RepID=UPI00146F7A76|nr:DUF2784 family protein [Nodosilinea sp. P-1105]NMF82444.1 DUF2784 family protein [Nodosilinea sp. P-1105]
MKTLRIFLILLLKGLHLIILVFSVAGWAAPFPTVWWVHGIFVPLMVGQWQINQGTCWLTNVENFLRGDSKAKSQQQGQFIKGILGRCFDPIPSDATLKRLIYGILALSWGLSVVRLLAMNL